MAIEKNPMQPSTPVEGTIEQGAEEVTVAIENPDSVAIQTDDGGMIIAVSYTHLRAHET